MTAPVSLTLAAYLLVCATLTFAELRRDDWRAFAIERGAWSITGCTQWWSFTWGVVVIARSGLIDVRLGFIGLTVRYDRGEAERQAQFKSDAKAVDSLLASLPREVPE